MKQTQPTPPGAATLQLYGVGQLAEGLKNDAFALFLLFYYREVLGLSGTLCGLALMLSLFSDAITDPLAGTLSDRLKTRWGRRHPFMYVAGPPVALTFYLVFAPPQGLSQAGLFSWLLGFTVLARLSMTLFHVPHLALGAELSPDYTARTRIVATRMVYERIGAALAGMLGLVVFMRPTEAFPDGKLNPDAYGPFAAVCACLMFTAIFISALGTHARIPQLRQVQGDPTAGAFASALQVLQLHSFRVHFVGSTVAYVGWGIMGTMALHLATYFWLVSTDELFLWGVGMAGGTFFGLGLWSRLAEQSDKKHIFVGGLGLYIAFTATPVFCKILGLWPARDSGLYLPCYILLTGFIAHIGIAGPMATGGSMMADITDEDELRHGTRREGVFFGAVSFAAKASVGVGAQVAGLLLDGVGLLPGTPVEQVSAEVVERLGLSLGITVAGLASVSMLIFSRYRLTRARHAELLAELRGKPPTTAAPSPDS